MEQEHIVIGLDRKISVPASIKKLIVQYDHNINTVVFDCPRYFGGKDLSNMTFFINYKRTDGELITYKADNMSIDESDNSLLHFSWTIGKSATITEGKISFSICAKSINDDGVETEHWNTPINSDITVSASLTCGGNAPEDPYGIKDGNEVKY